MIVADRITINFEDGTKFERQGIIITDITTIFEDIQSLVDKPITSLMIVLVKPRVE